MTVWECTRWENMATVTLGAEFHPRTSRSGWISRVCKAMWEILRQSTSNVGRWSSLGSIPMEMTDTTGERISEGRLRRCADMPLPEINARLLAVAGRRSRLAVGEPLQVRCPRAGEVVGLGSADMPPDLEVRQIGRDFVLGV